MNYLIKVVIILLVLATEQGYCHSLKFNTLRSLIKKYLLVKEDAHRFPYLVQLRPNGDIAILFIRGIRHGNKDNWYLNIIGNDGKMEIENKLIGQMPVAGSAFRHSSHLMISLSKNKIAVLPASSETACLTIFDDRGNNISSNIYKDCNTILPLLLADNDEIIYMVAQLGPVSVSIDVVDLTHNAKPVKLIDLYQKKYNIALKSKCCAALSKKNEILMGFRPIEMYWSDRKVYYSLFNLKGKELKSLVEIDITKHAYCKIRNFALPGDYTYKYTEYGLKKSSIINPANKYIKMI